MNCVKRKLWALGFKKRKKRHCQVLMRRHATSWTNISYISDLISPFPLWYPTKNQWLHLEPKIFLSVAFLKRKRFSSTCIVLCWSLKIAFKCIYLNQLLWHHFLIPAQHSGFVLSLSCLKSFPEREIADRSLNTYKLRYKIKIKFKWIIIFSFQTQDY